LETNRRITVDLRKQKEDHLEKIKNKYGNTTLGITLQMTLSEAWDELIEIGDNYESK
jgi:hypothetical protein